MPLFVFDKLAIVMAVSIPTNLVYGTGVGILVESACFIWESSNRFHIYPQELQEVFVKLLQISSHVSGQEAWNIDGRIQNQRPILLCKLCNVPR